MSDRFSVLKEHPAERPPFRSGELIADKSQPHIEVIAVKRRTYSEPFRYLKKKISFVWSHLTHLSVQAVGFVRQHVFLQLLDLNAPQFLELLAVQ